MGAGLAGAVVGGAMLGDLRSGADQVAMAYKSRRRAAKGVAGAAGFSITFTYANGCSFSPRRDTASR